MANAKLRLRLVDEHFDGGATADFRLEGPFQFVEQVQVLVTGNPIRLVQRQRLQVVVSEAGKFHNKIAEILLILLGQELVGMGPARVHRRKYTSTMIFTYFKFKVFVAHYYYIIKDRIRPIKLGSF